MISIWGKYLFETFVILNNTVCCTLLEKRRICCQRSSLTAAKSMLMQLSSVNDWRDNVERLRAWFMRCYEERLSNGDEPSTWIPRV